MDEGWGKCYNQVAMEGVNKEKVEHSIPTLEQQRDGSKGPGLTPDEVLATLSTEYAPFPREQRYDAITEVVFTILSQHTSDRNSERAFKQLMDTFGTLEKVAEGDIDLITRCITVGGLARIKAPRIKQVLNLIQDRRGCLDLSFLAEMPMEDAKAWLRELPGIGPKSAAIILCFALGMPAMAVDTHVYRVAKRLGLIGMKTNYEQAHEILERAVEPEQVYPFHVALITHGRKVCKAPRPLCHQCVLAYGCPSRHLGER